MAHKYNSAAAHWMMLRRTNPKEYRERMALRSIRIWKRNLALALRGQGFFKEDHCRVMLSLHVSRYTQVD